MPIIYDGQYRECGTLALWLSVTSVWRTVQKKAVDQAAYKLSADFTLWIAFL